MRDVSTINNLNLDGVDLQEVSDLLESTSNICRDFYSMGLGKPCGHVVVIAHVHCLPSVVPLIRYLILNVGVLAQDIFVVPKPYSTIDDVIKKLSLLGCRVLDFSSDIEIGAYDASAAIHLRQVCQRGFSAIKNRSASSKSLVILLDDGGQLTEAWAESTLRRSTQSHRTISIQQTASGVNRFPRSIELPKINVAHSAAKRHFESTIIARGVSRKVAHLQYKLPGRHVGIIGYGRIGSAVADRALTSGASVTIYDNSDVIPTAGIQTAASVEDLLQRTDMVFGCTGDSIIQSPISWNTEKDLVLFSCSSRDIEFRGLLDRQRTKFEEGQAPFGRARIAGLPNTLIENGGFPINFDRVREWERTYEIALTRALVFAAFFTAIAIQERMIEGWNLGLPFQIQENVVSEWLQQNLEKIKIDLCEREYSAWSMAMDKKLDEEWWTKNSGGLCLS